jgi:hypothetical protein
MLYKSEINFCKMNIYILYLDLKIVSNTLTKPLLLVYKIYLVNMYLWIHSIH